MKKILLLATIITIVQLCAAQGTFSGTIFTGKDGQPLYLATVTIYKAADTSIVSYKLSNEKGEFKITGIPIDLPCRVVITHTGYKVYRKNFTLTAEAKEWQAGSITLAEDSTLLDEVLVIAERPPMIVKKDTIEFNAASFKMLPNAMVEDLLKKLPGVTVDKDGNITVAGKRVNKILVDGKFFLAKTPKWPAATCPLT